MHDATIISHVKHFGQIRQSSNAIKGFPKLGRSVSSLNEAGRAPGANLLSLFATKPKPNDRVWAWPWLSGYMGVRRCVLLELRAQGERVWACWHTCATWCCGVRCVQFMHASYSYSLVGFMSQ